MTMKELKENLTNFVDTFEDSGIFVPLDEGSNAPISLRRNLSTEELRGIYKNPKYPKEVHAMAKDILATRGLVP